MEYVPAETSLVVAGPWNPAILTPAWVARYGMGAEPGSLGRVQVMVPALQGLMFELPRYRLEKFSYTVRPDALVLSPNEGAPGSLGELEDIAAKILSTLRHTPVSGVGHNFEFKSANPEAGQLETFTKSRQDLGDHVPSGWTAGSSAIVSSFKNETGALQINVHRQYDAGTIVIKVNFHHPVSSIDEAIAVLADREKFGSMDANRSIAEKFLSEIYNGGNG